MKYDPLREPNADDWFDLDEGERIGIVRDYHEEACDVEMPSLYLHCAFHATVENQLAGGETRVQETLQRLMEEGLDRHDAIHAIGMVLAEHMYNLAHGEKPEGDPNERYFEALEHMSAEKWKNSAE